MKIIITIILLIVFTSIVFISVRNFSDDHGFVVALDHWLDQFQSQEPEVESHQENDADKNDDVPSRVEIHKGLPAVKLSDEVISRSGIQTASLEIVTHFHEAHATGLVVDFQSFA